METWVEHLGHTSFAIRRGPLRLLIDPILVRQDGNFRLPTCPRWLLPESDTIDAVFLSHGHDDHLHPPSLLGLSPETAIYFLDEDPRTCSCAEGPELLLKSLGFHRVHAFRPGDVIELKEGVRVHIIPAAASTEGEEQCCFLVETPDVLVFDGVDVRDTPVTRDALKPFRGRVDVAFVPTGASLQWQGFWNQMDGVEALGFVRWLEPARVATCGGSLALAARPQVGVLERYPHDLADWLALAAKHLDTRTLITERPPYRLAYQEHRTQGCTPLQPASRRPPPAPEIRRPSALLATVFTGYNPHKPTRLLRWTQAGLAEWLRPFALARDVVSHSHEDLRALVKRCALSANKSPAAVFAPTTLRRLVTGGAWDLAARLTALIPPPPSEPAELEWTFFEVAEALLENAGGIAEPLRGDLRTCQWLDRELFHLLQLVHQMSAFAPLPQSKLAPLREAHDAALRVDLDRRRPMLTPHHLLLDAQQAALLTGEVQPPDVAALLCYADPVGVRRLPLTALEAFVLERCDGRSFGQLVDEVLEQLSMPRAEVHEALQSLLFRLSHSSVLLLDWSR
ncbi:MBL fold metallo-hydrolase [Hyalangium rubrum]|uniref:MBL fold metallo-hydrolase n=1 Tax=Hyalangium rubrum TaxID=3103134 RepID=A0ABU5H6C8_9BACT|nr:MBL fold metallo-hydrolase [Hyalangium sp. s54d21]MDY7228811.1 MBL fold metallo-hydrolase [Hyalangium sp. s54d21]